MTTETLSNIRALAWERKFPGCTDEFRKLFGVELPSPHAVAIWKNSWNERSPHVLELDRKRIQGNYTADLRAEIYAVTERLGIHPYFWEFVKRHDEVESTLPFVPKTVVTPTVTFYYEEHLVMFKLGW
jgi:hypothetical protein